LASLWEVAIKNSLGRPGFSVEPQGLHQAPLTQGYTEVGIHAPRLVRVASLPWIHRDPFDRLLLAQPIEDDLTLLTADAVLKRYGRFVKLVRRLGS
jgi:PIN domain nuclease of toxin-antitoxin system